LQSSALDKDFQRNYWEHNSNARDYRHPVVKFFVKQRLDWLKQYISLNQLKSAYDVGCGDGFATYYLSKIIKNVRGGDISEKMLKLNPLPRNRLQIIDAEKLPLKSGSFDLVYTWEVLHHIPNPAKAVNEMARVSKKYVAIFEPNRYNPPMFLFGLLTKQERGVLRSTKSNIENLCINAGLEIIASQYVGKIPPNKTPSLWLPFMRRLPFKSTVLSGISVAVIAQKMIKNQQLKRSH